MGTGNPERYFRAADLAERWDGQVSIHTLAQWRTRKEGPAYAKFGGRVVYAIEDIEAYEASRGIRPAEKERRQKPKSTQPVWDETP